MISESMCKNGQVVMSRNILLVWDRMGDYHRARWQAFQTELPDRKVFAADLAGSDKLYGWNTTADNPLYASLSKKPANRFDFSRIRQLVRILSEHNIGTICISGYGRPEYLMFILYGKFTGRKVILFAESWYGSNIVLDKLKSFFLRHTTDGFLVSGSRAFIHFTGRLKIPAYKIKTGYSVVDNAHFDRSAFQPRNFSKRILCVARFAPEKNLSLLINAFQKSKFFYHNWELQIVGGGPLTRELESLVSGGNNIKLSSWKSYDQMPEIYQQADIFILPSVFEPWGLVVNEAMAAGLPLLLSESVGCAPDLLTDGENGLIFQDNFDSLAEVLNKMFSFSFQEIAVMGSKSKEKIAEFSLAKFSGNLKALIES